MEGYKLNVSTHSRLKAAGTKMETKKCNKCGFNTQPPEGGWLQAVFLLSGAIHVSTHSRLKAAGSR